ncbi:MAG: sigma-70 family RNA polymerase sigma factor [Phycisphaerales bacterium]
MLEDKLLIWKFNRGSSKDAFCQIYEKYRDDLLRIAVGLLNQTATAEDVVQEVFTDFVSLVGDFKLTGHLKGYLAVCTANKARNVIRSQNRQRIISLDDCEIDPPDYKRPEQWIISNEQFNRLTNAFNQLPYEQKEAVILHVQGDMKFRAIAKLQDVSIKTVQSRYQYGITKLRSILNNEVQI